MVRKIPTSGVYRLALYSRYLSDLDKDDGEYVSSQQLASATGHTAAQVRRDLTHYGSLGEPGRGYEIGKLKRTLTKIFGREKIRNVILVGVGNLGRALIAYKGFQLQRFKIVAAFDIDPEKHGTKIEDVLIYDIQELEETIAGMDVDIAIVAVPFFSVQEVVDRIVSSGIKAILNFAPALVNVPPDIRIQNVDMSIELDRLYYFLKSSDTF